MTTVDMSAHIIPKSDQLNADDLIAGPRTIVITGVRANSGGEQQPISIDFAGDDGKPYKPCKGMRRVMVFVWGADASKYTGRSMTLFRNPSVIFGGMQVGGIQISHLSHIDAPMTMALTLNKSKRMPFTVQPLVVAATVDVAAMVAAFDAVADLAAFDAAESVRRDNWRAVDTAKKQALKAASDKARSRITPAV